MLVLFVLLASLVIFRALGAVGVDGLSTCSAATRYALAGLLVFTASAYQSESGPQPGLVLCTTVASMDRPPNLDQRSGDVRVYVRYARANSGQIRSQSVNWMAQPACGFSLLHLANGRRLARV